MSDNLVLIWHVVGGGTRMVTAVAPLSERSGRLCGCCRFCWAEASCHAAVCMLSVASVKYSQHLHTHVVVKMRRAKGMRLRVRNRGLPRYTMLPGCWDGLIACSTLPMQVQGKHVGNQCRRRHAAHVPASRAVDTLRGATRHNFVIAPGSSAALYFLDSVGMSLRIDRLNRPRSDTYRAMHQDAKLPMLSEDPSCSHDSEGSMWHLATHPQSVPDGDTGVPCMADELELQAEELEEQDPW